MSSWSKPQSPLVSTQWLAENLYSPDICIIDASWFLNEPERNARDEYENCHIPNAVFFDIDEISDSASQYPHMLPSPEKFASRVKRLGLGDGMHFVIYDSVGIFSAPRVWWMFRAMGHEDVVVLDGGLKKWIEEGRPTDDMLPMSRERHYTVRVRNDLIKGFYQVLNASQNKTAQIIDARSAARFNGQEEEPRPCVSKGHIPNSKNLPWGTLVNQDGTMISDDEIRAKFENIGTDLKAPIITSCGSGVSACILALALAKIGKDQVAVYDGSWAEWGSRDDAPIEENENVE